MTLPWSAAVSDDTARFRALFDTEFVAIVGYAARRLDDPADAADVAADVFMIAWRRIADVPPGPQARPWLYGVARNVMLNHTRGVRRRGRLADRLRSELSVRGEAGAAAPSDIAALRQALSGLPEDDRELMLLTAWEGLTPSEIAVVLEVPAGTVRSRLHRVRRALRLALGSAHDKPLERSAPTGQVRHSEQSLAANHEDER